METGTDRRQTNDNEDKRFSGIFQKDSTQVGIMAGVVTMVSQPFAQSRMQEMFGLAEWLPVVVALVVSAVLAAYHVFGVHRAKVLEGLLLMPLVAMIVFSSYAGTNQLFAANAAGNGAPDKAAEARVRNLESELNLQKQLNDQLIRSLGLAPEETAQGRVLLGPQTRSGMREAIERALSWLVSSAYSQDGKPTGISDEQRRRLAEQIRQSRQKQEKLEMERRRLEEESRQAANRRPPLLKSW